MCTQHYRVFGYFSEQFFRESLQLAVCRNYRLSSLQTPAWPPEARPSVWCVQCCLQPCRYQSNEWPLLQATRFCSWKTSQCSALLFARNCVVRGEPHRCHCLFLTLQTGYELHIQFGRILLTACTACICLNVQLSFNYQASVLFVCSINLSLLLWG